MDFSTALGAGDLNLPLPSGNAADGFAVFADKILVVLVLPALFCAAERGLQAKPEGAPLAVFLLAFVDVFGKHAKNGDAPERHAEIVENADAQQAGEQAGNETHPHQGQVQVIHAVAAIHEAGKAGADFLQEFHVKRPLFSIVLILLEKSFTVNSFWGKFTNWTY
mgnify:CR=1 FL=1